jgi:hypothetical protein
MARNLLRRRRPSSRLVVEALETRYVMDASANLAVPLVEIAHPDAPRSAVTDLSIALSNSASNQAPRDSFLLDSASRQSVIPVFVSVPLTPELSPTPLASPLNSPISAIAGEFAFAEYSNSRFETRGLFGDVHNDLISFSVTVQTFESISAIPNRSGPVSEESAEFLGSARSSNPLEQSAVTNALRSEEAPVSLNASRADGSAIASARHTDSVVAAVLPTDHRTDRPGPTAFATALAADAVRAADGIGDPNRPSPNPADLTTPRYAPSPGNPQGDVDSTSLRPPIQSARDSLFAGLFVDGFAPRLLDHAFRALKTVETNLESPSGSNWYRIAIGCWVVAAALAYEASRQTRDSVARTLRYASTSLDEFEEPEDER